MWSARFHGHFPQLFTPMQLNRCESIEDRCFTSNAIGDYELVNLLVVADGGNTRDPDPLYDPNCVRLRQNTLLSESTNLQTRMTVPTYCAW